MEFLKYLYINNWPHPAARRDALADGATAMTEFPGFFTPFSMQQPASATWDQAPPPCSAGSPWPDNGPFIFLNQFLWFLRPPATNAGCRDLTNRSAHPVEFPGLPFTAQQPLTYYSWDEALPPLGQSVCGSGSSWTGNGCAPLRKQEAQPRAKATPLAPRSDAARKAQSAIGAPPKTAAYSLIGPDTKVMKPPAPQPGALPSSAAHWVITIVVVLGLVIACAGRLLAWHAIASHLLREKIEKAKTAFAANRAEAARRAEWNFLARMRPEKFAARKRKAEAEIARCGDLARRLLDQAEWYEAWFQMPFVATWCVRQLRARGWLH